MAAVRREDRAEYQSPSGRGPGMLDRPRGFSKPIANNAVPAPPGFFVFFAGRSVACQQRSHNSSESVGY
ncbi:unnamed protein product [Boreogadus saida]